MQKEYEQFLNTLKEPTRTMCQEYLNGVPLKRIASNNNTYPRKARKTIRDALSPLLNDLQGYKTPQEKGTTKKII